MRPIDPQSRHVATVGPYRIYDIHRHDQDSRPIFAVAENRGGMWIHVKSQIGQQAAEAWAQGMADWHAERAAAH